jgi:hypothetical protein
MKKNIDLKYVSFFSLKHWSDILFRDIYKNHAEVGKQLVKQYFNRTEEWVQSNREWSHGSENEYINCKGRNQNICQNVKFNIWNIIYDWNQ